MTCFHPTPFQRRDAGSPGRARVFIYLALSVVFLLLSYQLVLNHESTSSWAAQQGFTFNGDNNNANANANAESSVDVDVDFDINLVTIYEDDSDEPLPPNERELIFAAIHDTDMSWVEDNLHEWPVNIYRADVSSGREQLTVPMNKGNEGMVYLT